MTQSLTCTLWTEVPNFALKSWSLLSPKISLNPNTSACQNQSMISKRFFIKDVQFFLISFSIYNLFQAVFFDCFIWKIWSLQTHFIGLVKSCPSFYICKICLIFISRLTILWMNIDLLLQDCDETEVSLLCLEGIPGVTRMLEVEYVKPVLVGVASGRTPRLAL